MRKLSPRESILLGIVGLAAVVYLWYVSEKTLSSRSAELMDVEVGDLLADTAPRVPMDLLAPSGDGYDRKGRDLFQYSKRPPTAEELEAERRRREALLRQQQEAAEQRRAAAP